MAVQQATGVATGVAAARSPILAVDGIRGYFHSQRAGLDGRLTARLVEFLDGTKDSLDCAIYDLRHPDILAALARLVARNVRVRIAFDAGAERSGGVAADPKPSGSLQALASAGLLSHATPVHERGRHLMHLKVAIRDAQAVWVGSANFTRGGLELQDNACLQIASGPFAAAFTATFEDLLRPSHRHVSVAHSAGPAPVQVGGALLRPLFAPAAGEGIEDSIAAALRGARKIRVMAFLLSDPGILDALAPLAADPGFDIRGVYDPHGMQDALRYTRQDHARFWFLTDPRFVAAPSHAFSPGREQDFMHNKTLIVDDRLVFTGSYNFSENAEANDEVVLAVTSAPVAAAYTDYFDTLFGAYRRHGATQAPEQLRGEQPRGEQPRERATAQARRGGAPEPVAESVAQPSHSHATPRRQAEAASAAAAASRESSRASRARRPREERRDLGRAAERRTHSGARRRRALDVLLVVTALLTLAVAIALVVVLIASGILHP